jgi:acetylornithine deacetylase/succinyl-diaminopimelate desuccinylase-like protein
MTEKPENLPNECIASFSLKVIPGMTIETVKKDVEDLIEKLKLQDPDIDAKVRIWDVTYPSTVISSDEPIVQVVRKTHKAIFAQEAKIQEQEAPWIYGATDATMWWNIAKVPCAIYGAGGAEGWVFPDERQDIRQLIDSSKVYALSALDICTRPKKQA